MKWLIILLTSLSLTACGFHFRNRDMLPAAMNSINTVSPNASFTGSLEDTFSSVGIQLSQTSPFQLKITHYLLTQSEPSIITAGTPTTVSYSLSVTTELRYHNQIIATNSFSSSQPIIQNVNSLQATKAGPSLILQFQNDIIEQIFLWMSSTDVKQKLRPSHAN